MSGLFADFVGANVVGSNFVGSNFDRAIFGGPTSDCANVTGPNDTIFVSIFTNSLHLLQGQDVGREQADILLAQLDRQDHQVARF